jgi:hypothetical protein
MRNYGYLLEGLPVSVEGGTPRSRLILISHTKKPRKSRWHSASDDEYDERATAVSSKVRPCLILFRLVRYSITSSARSRIDGGMARPSAVAVLRFTTISNFVGAA